MSKYEKVVNALCARHFKAMEFATAEEAKAEALSLIGSESVGFGGSMTVDSAGIYDELAKKGSEVHWHWKVPAEEVQKTRDSAYTSQWYLSSTNALTESGLLVNIDGAGNRVVAQIYGPKKQIVFVGRNKIVAGGVEDAIARIKKCASGPNAKRLNLKTPCATTMECADCDSPQRVCRAITILERPTMPMQEFYVFIIDEDMGY